MSYFYKFVDPISKELAKTLKELEGAIYNSPRSMLTHSRTMIEALLEKVMVHEDIRNEPFLTIHERIKELDDSDLLSKEVKDALHEVRKYGNLASHETRPFRYSDSLITWEHVHTIMTWFVEVYGSYEIEVPAYVDPQPKIESSYNSEELTVRLNRLEELLKQSIISEKPEKIDKEIEVIEIEEFKESIDIEPGLTSIRSITYQSESINIPHFLRDAFLLPQRFEESERYVLRLNEAQQARIMSELPTSLDRLHERVVRYYASHTENFFDELNDFIKEEIRRKKLMKDRPGELFLFYKGEEIIVTEQLGDQEISKEAFTGAPGLIDQLHDDGIFKVRDLPKELIIIGKYQGVGIGRVTSFFEQLNELQKNK